MNRVDLHKGADWFKSSYSNGNGDCIEVAAVDGAVVMRDSKQADGPIVASTSDEWQTFVRGVVNGRLRKA